MRGLPPSWMSKSAAGLAVLLILVAACTPAPAPAARGTAAEPPAAPAAGPASGSAAAALPTAAPAAAPLRVRYGLPSAAVHTFYLTVAREQGFYREQGLDVELTHLAANVVLAALTAGEIDYSVGVPGGIRLALRGQPVKIASAVALLNYTLVTPPSITAPEQLRGKTVAITAPGTANDQAVRRTLAHLGLDPQADVTPVIIGNNAVHLQALQAGSIEAAALALPYSVQAEREGLRPWLRTDALYRAVTSGVVAPRAALDERREEIVRLIRAELAAVRSMKANPEAAAALMAQHLDLPPDVASAVVHAALDAYLDNPDPAAHRDALETVIALERDAVGQPAAAVGWDDLVETSLAREALR